MLKTIKIKNLFKNFLIFKEINNIIIYIINIHKLTTYNKLINNYFIKTFIIFYFRLIWRGKAYRVRFFKKFNKFTFNFGYSHWTKLLYDINNYNVIKIKRQNYIIIYFNHKNKLYVLNFFNNIRTFNKYTKRGLRLKQTPVIRRFGKISQVNSSLHSFGQ
jgi:hypothetical protein